MIKLVKYNTEDMMPIFTEFFSQDKDLLNKYHRMAGTDLLTCAKETRNTAMEDNSQFYLITEDNELLAYFSKCMIQNDTPYMDNFFVKMKYRNKEYLPNIWNSILTHFEEPFLTAVNIKNDRAIKYYTKYGRIMNKFNYEEGIGYFFSFNRSL